MIPLHSWVPAIGQWLGRLFAPVMNMILSGDFSLNHFTFKMRIVSIKVGEKQFEKKKNCTGLKI